MSDDFEARCAAARLRKGEVLAALAAVADPILRAVIDHHSREPEDSYWSRNCMGCDQGCSCDAPEWPCSTIVLICEWLGVDMTDMDLARWEEVDVSAYESPQPTPTTDRRSTMTATDPVQAVAEAVKAHLWHHTPTTTCSCGWVATTTVAGVLDCWTEHVAEAAVKAAGPLIAAETLREAGGWLDSFEGPGGRQSAHDRAGRDIIRLLRARADDLEAGR